MDISAKELIPQLYARPFMTTFNRQRNTAQKLFGRQLSMPLFSRSDITDLLEPMIGFYPVRDREIIREMITECIFFRQKQ